MEVSVDRLRTISEVLLKHIEQHRGGNLEIESDYYWDIPEDSRYDRYQEPSRHTVGQLSDDIVQLDRMIDGNRPVIGYALVWFAAVLRRIGETAEC
ncbi:MULTISPECIES: hypothetical protein [unclassified Bradyrhizobium]|uniref:hypothetical protein n=1 Tax=unclassified Bradyrhizobium TaxID=2631580 RepID=UPI0028E39BD6|nr:MULTISPECIES: hypothetical protein [unclassified Bradyrhizobium]